MRVRARYNVKDATGWHKPGDVFDTEENLGDAVEVLKAANVTPEAVPVETTVEEKPEEPQEAPNEEVKPAKPRRKKTGA